MRDRLEWLATWKNFWKPFALAPHGNPPLTQSGRQITSCILRISVMGVYTASAHNNHANSDIKWLEITSRVFYAVYRDSSL